MNFGLLAIKSLVILALLFLLSLAGAVTFPVLAVVTGTSAVGLVNLISLLVAVFILSILGNLLGRGIKGLKKPIEALILTYLGAFFMGGILSLFTYLNVPYAAHINLGWLGTNWYSSWLTMLLIGTTIMVVFLVGE
ncbi:hypothetical protein EPA93_24195 [Ktedonosporobacter rubrisoli]|uniref:Uncharacterized protein n=1 Tax=Ktedonosporobacter rubrisoli TaxID=2509675 RepID=A0A4P6JTY1_KTERU|nr:hypothetical protein [Ktedonosporobacter rubrisoli]QBD78914.1 hypothetical protein EPA93_24195 [Ktedonosporobacter rubrisoli]